METLTGTVSRFIFKTDTFAIFKLDNITALGEITGIREGDRLTVTGTWQNHPKYGRQLKIETWEKPVPSTREAAVAFLSSGLIKGVGPVLAERIVDNLGPDAVNKIMKEPDALKKVKGIGRKAPEIRRQIQETYQVQQVVTELIKLGLTVKTALKAYKKFGMVTAEYVRRNPYCLTELELIGFHRANEVAGRVGLAPSSPFRIKAGILHVLIESLWNEGHTYLPRDVLLSRSLELLNHREECVTAEMLEKEMNRIEEICGDAGISLAWAREYEEAIARDVRALARRRFDVPALPKNLLEGVELTLDQENAVKVALGSGFSILTGGPGVGKTQTVKAVIRAFELQNPWGKVLLCAPTGRAARRLSEMTGRHAHTVHKLLGLRDDRAAHDCRNPLDCDLLIVDEASMADIVMTRRLLSAVPNGARVLFVGDADQLPSVGPGNVLRDLLDKVPTVRLTKIFRQAAESRIVTNAHRINRGQMPLFDRSKPDFVFLDRESPEDIAKCIKTCVSGLGYDLMDVQVLSPMRKGPVGTIELNRLIQGNKTGPKIQYGAHLYRVGDKVIHTKNNYSKMVFNGDIGIVKEIRNRDGEPELLVQYNGDLVPYDMEDLKELELAWAVTVHKCVSGETWIWTNNGLRRIKELALDLLPGQVREFGYAIGTPEGMLPASHIMYIGKKPTVRITTRIGLTLEASTDHKLLVTDDKNGENRWVVAAELKPGMRLPVPRGMIYGPSEKLSTAEFHPNPHPRGRRNNVRWPETVNEDLAEVLGAFVADANYTDRKDGRVELFKNNNFWRTYIKEMTEKLFGVKCTSRRMGNNECFYFHSKTVREFLAWCGLNYVRAHKKNVPWVVLQSPPSVQTAFLRGLFSGDGGYNGTVVLATSSPELAEQVQLLLLNLGVLSKRYLMRGSADRRNEAWRLEITGQDNDRFNEVIGFKHPQKIQTTVAARQARHIVKTNWDTIPGGQMAAAQLREALIARDGRNYKASHAVKKMLWYVSRGISNLTLS